MEESQRAQHDGARPAGPDDRVVGYLRSVPWLRDLAARLFLVAASVARRAGPVGHVVADLADRVGMALARRATGWADDLRRDDGVPPDAKVVH